MKNKKILIGIIAYNEDKNIINAINDIREHYGESDVILIDDCSTDKTRKIAMSMGVKVIKHPVNLNTSGFTSVKTSFLYAYRNGYDIYCQFDGDAQHDARYLKTITEPIIAGSADLVVGSRFLSEKSFRSTLPRRIGVKIFSFITSFLVGQKIVDISSGFKAYGPKVINLFAEKYPYPIVDTNEILIVSHYAGAVIKEVPVRMKLRLNGKSCINLYKTSVFPIRIATYIFGLFLQRKRYSDKEG